VRAATLTPDWGGLTGELADAIFRIGYRSTAAVPIVVATNVAKHAAASHARVSVHRDGAVVRCEDADDGRGGADTSSGTGILGLRDRAEAAGGTLSLVSPPGRGTVVTAVLPLTDG